MSFKRLYIYIFRSRDIFLGNIFEIGPLVQEEMSLKGFFLF